MIGNQLLPVTFTQICMCFKELEIISRGSCGGSFRLFASKGAREGFTCCARHLTFPISLLCPPLRPGHPSDTQHKAGRSADRIGFAIRAGSFTMLVCSSLYSLPPLFCPQGENGCLIITHLASIQSCQVTDSLQGKL